VQGLTKVSPGAGNVELTERRERPLAAGEVAIAVAGTGICGTDLHIEAGEYPSVPPVTMGHEVSGRVSEVGDGVDPSWLGARVVTETYYSTCGRCAFCRAGRINLCPERRSIGTHVDGGFAPRVVVPAQNLHRVPSEIDDHTASLIEPLACVCNSLLDPPAVSPGQDALVLGPGAIGLLAAQVAASGGATVHVRGMPHDRARLALAERLGFETSVVPEDAGREVYDVVIECSGSGAAITYGLRSAQRGGQFVLIGLSGAPVTVPFDEICFRELHVRSGFASTPRSWRHALALLEGGRIVLGPLVTSVLPLAEWRQAFAASRGGEGVKYILDPR
jgi:L-iditol 2-dehydrogenase